MILKNNMQLFLKDLTGKTYLIKLTGEMTGVDFYNTIEKQIGLLNVVIVQGKAIKYNDESVDMDKLMGSATIHIVPNKKFTEGVLEYREKIT